MVRVYRNIAMPVLFFGLELMDLLVLAVLFLIVFNASDRLILNLLLLFGSYLALRYFKKGKPSGYTLHLARFIASDAKGHVLLEFKGDGHGRR